MKSIFLIEIFPNPVSGTRLISGLPSNKSVTVDLLNASGREVFTTETKHLNAINIDTEAFQSGLYLLRIYDFNWQVVKKIVVKE